MAYDLRSDERLKNWIYSNVDLRALTPDERALYAELTAQIAMRMVENWARPDLEQKFDLERPRADRSDIKERIIEHGFMGDFEEACHVLHYAGAIYPIDKDGKVEPVWVGMQAAFLIVFNADGIRNHVLKDLPPTAPTLERVLLSFLSLFCGYGNPPVSTRRHPFAVPGELEPAFEKLTRCGFVDRRNGRFEWADEIAPMMAAISAWDEDGNCKKEAEEKYTAELAGRMWQTMPEKFRTLLFSGDKVDVLSLEIVISCFWYNDAWQEVNVNERKDVRYLPANCRELARALKRIYLESGNETPS